MKRALYLHQFEKSPALLKNLPAAGFLPLREGEVAALGVNGRAGILHRRDRLFLGAAVIGTSPEIAVFRVVSTKHRSNVASGFA